MMTTQDPPNLVLASQSPRRRALMEMLQLPFTVEPSGADETVDDRLPPARIVQMLAERKARAVIERLSGGAQGDEGGQLVIGSDTIVTLDGKVLGKPAGFDEAVDMLSRLEARTHTVFTGLCVRNALTGEQELGFSATHVSFRPLEHAEIVRYVETGEPLDKAGAYGIQGFGSTLVTKIAGDYFTVVGLPLFLLADYLRKFGVNVF